MTKNHKLRPLTPEEWKEVSEVPHSVYTSFPFYVYAAIAQKIAIKNMDPLAPGKESE